MDLPINTIICGDCLEVMRDWPDGCVDAVITDPPYGTGETLKAHGVQYHSCQEWDTWSTRWVECIEARTFAVFCPPKMLHELAAIGGRSARLIAWCKPNPIANKGVSPRYGLQHLVLWGPRPAHYGLDWMVSSVGVKATGHPHQKPLGVMQWLVEMCTEPGDLILDPFCGSGTTCVAAKQLGRRYIGIDIAEKYCQVARDRLDGVTVLKDGTRQRQLTLFKEDSP